MERQKNAAERAQHAPSSAIASDSEGAELGFDERNVVGEVGGDAFEERCEGHWAVSGMGAAAFEVFAVAGAENGQHVTADRRDDVQFGVPRSLSVYGALPRICQDRLRRTWDCPRRGPASSGPHKRSRCRPNDKRPGGWTIVPAIGVASQPDSGVRSDGFVEQLGAAGVGIDEGWDVGHLRKIVLRGRGWNWRAQGSL